MSFFHFNHSHEDGFDPEQDMDLIAAVNEARTDQDLARVSSMAKRRFAARARARARDEHAANRAAASGRLRRSLSLRLAQR